MDRRNYFIIPIALVLTSILAIGCSEDNDVFCPDTGSQEEACLTVDISASPPQQRINEKFHFHADVRGEHDLIQWSHSNRNHPEPIVFGTGQDVQQKLGFGHHLIRADVFYEGAVTGWDTLTVLTLPPLTPRRPSVHLSSDCYLGQPPFYFQLRADITPGDAPITDIKWHEITEDGGRHFIANYGDSLQAYMPIVGKRAFEVEVTDQLCMTDADTVTIVGMTMGAYSWRYVFDLKVGPSQVADVDSMYEHSPMAPMMPYHLRGLFHFGVSDENRAPLVMEIEYSDGSRWYYTIPDVNPERPSEVLVHFGEVPIEWNMKVRLHYTGSPDPAVTEYNGLQSIYGNLEFNKQTNYDIQVTGSRQRPDILPR